MSVVHEQLVELLHVISRGMGKYARDVLSTHDMPLSLLMISRQIKAEPGITISEMARRTGIAKSHVFTQIRKLEERGWVEKKSDDSDQRIIRLYLSQPACNELVLLGGIIRQQMSVLLADISEQRAEELLADLKEIKQVMERNPRQNQPESVRHE